MVKKFSATLDVEFIIDFEVWGIPKEEQHKFLSKSALMSCFLSLHGFDDFKIVEVSSGTLLEVMDGDEEAVRNYNLEEARKLEILEAKRLAYNKELAKSYSKIK